MEFTGSNFFMTTRLVGSNPSNYLTKMTFNLIFKDYNEGLSAQPQ